MLWTPPSLSLCWYVCLYRPEIFCLKGLVLSARMYVMVFQDKHILTKWNILSNCLLIYSRGRIFHFGRVWLSWEHHYIHTSRENKAFETEYFWPIQTYIRAERMPFICIDILCSNHYFSHQNFLNFNCVHKYTYILHSKHNNQYRRLICLCIFSLNYK